MALLCGLSGALAVTCVQAAEIAHPLGCDIKGNVGAKNNLFYVPGHPRYHMVKINRTGERWFCSEGDALAAGWKPAGSLTGRADSSTAKQHTCAPSPDAPPGCAIKGNINSKKQRIYHVPCSGHYPVTEIRTERGERWFCSEDEARSAGWRAPRGR